MQKEGAIPEERSNHRVSFQTPNKTKPRYVEQITEKKHHWRQHRINTWR
jgi:hypothetical protein